MKKIAVAIGLAIYAFAASAGETWSKETYESGETVYASGYVGAFNTLFVIGERGVAILYPNASGKTISEGSCSISIDGRPAEVCTLELGSRYLMIKNPKNLANNLANAKRAQLKVRICKGWICAFALNGGTTEEINWEWDEPLSTTFPDFKPYPVK